MNKQILIKIVIIVLIFLCVPSFISCSKQKTVSSLNRESLFALSYGVLEDQLNLFSLDGMDPSYKTRIVMRDGIFYVSNGNAAKIMTFSSFGDLLSMIYNSEKNPAPVVLKETKNGEKVQGRFARQYPFIAPGEIGVDSKRTIFVEDRVPDRKLSYDDVNMANLGSVILRFSRDGEYMDYIGQEGVGGTPFPPLQSLYITENDECIVISVSGAGWLVYVFDSFGTQINHFVINRNELLYPDTEESSIASVDNIIAMPDGKNIAIKIDYYREVIDPETKAQAGIEFSSSWVFFIDTITKSVTSSVELPMFESIAAKRNNETVIPRAWTLAGAASNSFYLTIADEDDTTYYAVWNINSKVLNQFSLRIDPDELFYTTFSLSPDGILSALLGSQYEARFVWWRFDKIGKNK